MAMTLEQMHTVFRNHTHTGAHPDAKRLPDTAIPGARFQAAIVLRSSGGNRFILSVDDDGALTTSPANFSNILVSPNGTRFALGIDSDGAPTTAESSCRFNAYMPELEDLPLYDSVGTKFYLSVADDGVLITRPA